MEKDIADQIFSVTLDFNNDVNWTLYVSERQLADLEDTLFDPGQKGMRFISISYYEHKGNLMDEYGHKYIGEELFSGAMNIIVNIEKIYTVHRLRIKKVKWYEYI